MAKRCKDCGGAGRWTEREEVGGEVTTTAHYCNTCSGRGFVTEDHEIDDFDLAGVGATEDDDDDEF